MKNLYCRIVDLSIVRQISVAFRSAKVAFLHSFAERKTTVKNRKMLNGLNAFGRTAEDSRSTKFYIGLVLCIWFMVAPRASAQTMSGFQADANSERVSFDAVQPILRKNCERCHNEDQPRGDLVLTSLDKVLAGSSSGNVVVAGKLEESPLYLLTSHMDTPKMPPNKPRIPQRELNVIERWIVTGLIEETQGSEKSVSEKPQASPSIGAIAEPSMKSLDKTNSEIQSTASTPNVFSPLVAIPQPTAVRAMAPHPSEPVVAVAGLHQVAILNTDSAEFGAQAIDVGERDISALRFSPDGKILLIAAGMTGESGSVLVLDWQTKQWLPSVGDESDNIQSIDCNSDASQIAIGTTTRLVKMFGHGNPNELFVLRKHTDWVLSVAYSRDGILLASGDRFGGIHVWETDTGKEFAALRGHAGGITGLVWSPDGNELSSSSLDGTVRVWNMHTLQAKKQWVANDRGVLSLAMDTNQGLLTSGRDGWVRKWFPNGTAPSWQTQLPDEVIAICNSVATPSTLIAADAAGGIYRLGSSVSGSNEPAAKVQISMPISVQTRLFAASAPDAPKRISVKPIMNSVASEPVLDRKPFDSRASSSDLGNSTLLSDLEESRRALDSVEQSLEQTYQSAERLEESVVRLKQLILLQEARLKQLELKQKPNRK